MRARQHTLLLWLIPLLVLRGLVPAGFMIDTSHGNMSMVICSGGVYKTVLLDAQGQNIEQAEQHETSSSVCPYTLSTAGATAFAVPPMLLGTGWVVDRLDTFAAEFHWSFGPSRAHQPRAPPYFS